MLLPRWIKQPNRSSPKHRIKSPDGMSAYGVKLALTLVGHFFLANAG
jgi:hypothetical protein